MELIRKLLVAEIFSPFSALIIIAFALAVLFMIWGGINWLRSGHDKRKTKEAKMTIIKANVGFITVLFAYLIIRTIAIGLGLG